MEEMADALYLSLWYPNLRLASLPDKLAAVLGSFASHGGDAKVYAVTVWPVSWQEAPVFQRVYGRAGGGAGRGRRRVCHVRGFAPVRSRCGRGNGAPARTRVTTTPAATGGPVARSVLHAYAR